MLKALPGRRDSSGMAASSFCKNAATLLREGRSRFPHTALGVFLAIAQNSLLWSLSILDFGAQRRHYFRKSLQF